MLGGNGGGGIDNLLSQMQANQAETKSKLQKLSGEEAEAMKKPMAEIDAVEKKGNELKPPELEKLPEAPQPVHSDPLQTFGSPASWLAVFGGLLTKNHLMNSLNAAAGVMNARNQQDAAATRYQEDLWKTNVDNAMKMNQFKLDSYRDAIQKLGSDRETALADLRVLAASFGDQATYITSGNKDDASVAKLYAASLSMQEKLQKSRDQQGELDAGIDAKTQEFTQKNGREPTPAEQWQIRQDVTREMASAKKGAADQGTKGVLTDDKYQELKDLPEVKRAAVGLNSGQTPSQVMPGRSPTNPELMAAMRLASEEKPDLNPALAGSELKANQSSLTNMTKMADSATAYERTALSNMQIIEELLPTAAGTDLGPLVNKYIQEGKIATGNVSVDKLVTAIGTLSGEYAKIMSGATGSVAAPTDATQAAANNMLNLYKTTGQIKGSLDIMKRDMKNKTDSYEEQKKQIQDSIGGGSTLRGSSSSPPPKDQRKAGVTKWTNPQGHELTWDGNGWVH
jgi:hypothetical protein